MQLRDGLLLRDMLCLVDDGPLLLLMPLFAFLTRLPFAAALLLCFLCSVAGPFVAGYALPETCNAIVMFEAAHPGSHAAHLLLSSNSDVSFVKMFTVIRPLHRSCCSVPTVLLFGVC